MSLHVIVMSHCKEAEQGNELGAVFFACNISNDWSFNKGVAISFCAR